MLDWFDFSHEISDSAGETAEVKFDLYVQSRRVTQITQALEQVAFADQHSQSEWVIQYQVQINQLLNDLLEDSLLVLDGVQLDQESMHLSLELMADIRHALDMLEHLVRSNRGYH